MQKWQSNPLLSVPKSLFAPTRVLVYLRELTLHTQSSTDNFFRKDHRVLLLRSIVRTILSVGPNGFVSPPDEVISSCAWFHYQRHFSNSLIFLASHGVLATYTVNKAHHRGEVNLPSKGRNRKNKNGGSQIKLSSTSY